MKTRDLPDILAIGLLIGFLGFEVANFATTFTSLKLYLGSVLYAVILTCAIGLVDLGGLYRVVTPSINEKDEPVEVWILFGAWVVVAIFNAIFTWWGLAYAAETSGGVTPEAIRGHEWIVPIALAMGIFLIRTTLIYLSGQFLDHAINGPRKSFSRPAARPQPMPAPRPQTSFPPSKPTSFPVAPSPVSRSAPSPNGHNVHMIGDD